MSTAPFDAARCQALCRTLLLQLGSTITYKAVTGSTNDDAREALANGAGHGAVIVAGAQTKGRGRRGNPWLSTPGENLLFSAIVKLPIPQPRWSLVPLTVGLGLREVVASRVAGVAKVKWPNDVLVEDRKIAGVLVESSLRVGQEPQFVIGVGLNVEARSFPPELDAKATSLAMLGAVSTDREQLLCEVLAQLEKRLAMLLEGDDKQLIDELARLDALIGKTVRVGEQCGIARGIANDGALLLEDDSGRLHRVVAGHVS